MICIVSMEVLGGSGLPEQIAQAIQTAEKADTVVSFVFNDVKILVRQDSDPALIKRDYERAIHGQFDPHLLALADVAETFEERMLRGYFRYALSHDFGAGIVIGPYPEPVLSVEAQAWHATMDQWLLELQAAYNNKYRKQQAASDQLCTAGMGTHPQLFTRWSIDSPADSQGKVNGFIDIFSMDLNPSPSVWLLMRVPFAKGDVSQPTEVFPWLAEGSTEAGLRAAIVTCLAADNQSVLPSLVPRMEDLIWFTPPLPSGHQEQTVQWFALAGDGEKLLERMIAKAKNPNWLNRLLYWLAKRRRPKM